VQAVARSFTLSVQIAAPFIAFGILFNLGLGVIEAGVATKNTCICGIRRESTPRPRLNRMPKAMNGCTTWRWWRSAIPTP
jgi:hypothetical protein